MFYVSSTTFSVLTLFLSDISHVSLFLFVLRKFRRNICNAFDTKIRDKNHN